MSGRRSANHLIVIRQTGDKDFGANDGPDRSAEPIT